MLHLVFERTLLRTNSIFAIYSINLNDKNMIRGNFLGAAIVAIIYTIYILRNPITTIEQKMLLVILNALTIVLMAFAFK